MSVAQHFSAGDRYAFPSSSPGGTTEFWNRKTIAYTEEEWATLIRHPCIGILMLQNVAKDSIAESGMNIIFLDALDKPSQQLEWD
ncbi:MAG TPA: hypothetical protein VGM23_05780 [Armatimonadota bacterium]